jgi:hypothetical protein
MYNCLTNKVVFKGCTNYETKSKRNEPNEILVVDKFLFCLFWRMVHKSYTLNFCLEEWFINLLIHAYQYKMLLRLFHHFSFHSCCSYWNFVYFRFVLQLICIIVWQTRLFSRVVLTTKRNRNATNQTKYYAMKYTKMRNATKYTKMQNETKIYKIPIRTGPTLEILQKPRQEYLDILLTSFIEGAPYRKEDSTWHNGRW